MKKNTIDDRQLSSSNKDLSRTCLGPSKFPNGMYPNGMGKANNTSSLKFPSFSSMMSMPALPRFNTRQITISFQMSPTKHIFSGTAVNNPLTKGPALNIRIDFAEKFGQLKKEIDNSVNSSIPKSKGLRDLSTTRLSYTLEKPLSWDYSTTFSAVFTTLSTFATWDLKLMEKARKSSLQLSKYIFENLSKINIDKIEDLRDNIVDKFFRKSTEFGGELELSKWKKFLVTNNFMKDPIAKIFLEDNYYLEKSTFSVNNIKKVEMFARGSTFIGIGLAAYAIITSDNKEQTINELFAAFGGSLAGAYLGGKAGTFICPFTGPYSPVCFGALTILGSVGGSIVGVEGMNNFKQIKTPSEQLTSFLPLYNVNNSKRMQIEEIECPPVPQPDF